MSDEEESFELAAKPIVAWRMWNMAPWPKLTPDPPPGLYPMVGKGMDDDPWPADRPMEAECFFPHRCPAPESESVELWNRTLVNNFFEDDPKKTSHPKPACGIYALKSEERARSKALMWSTLCGGAFWGEVELWGTVYEHADGYRAQWARPISLYTFSDARHLKRMKEISQIYGLELQTKDRPKYQAGPAMKWTGRMLMVLICLVVCLAAVAIPHALFAGDYLLGLAWAWNLAFGVYGVRRMWRDRRYWL